jgi:hypothetical protein
LSQGSWTLLDARPAGVLYFQHSTADADLHFSSAAAYGVAVLVLVLGLRTRRRDAAGDTILESAWNNGLT